MGETDREGKKGRMVEGEGDRERGKGRMGEGDEEEGRKAGWVRGTERTDEVRRKERGMEGEYKGRARKTRLRDNGKERMKRQKGE